MATAFRSATSWLYLHRVPVIVQLVRRVRLDAVLANVHYHDALTLSVPMRELKHSPFAPGHRGGVAPGHLGGVAPGHRGGVAPGHLGGVAPGHSGGVAHMLSGVVATGSLVDG